MIDSDNIDSNFSDIILILQSVWDDKDGDKIWDKNDWLLDDKGTAVYL